MPSPESYAAFIIVNAVIWPTFSLVYYYLFQRRDENLIDSMEQASGEVGAEAEG